MNAQDKVPNEKVSILLEPEAWLSGMENRSVSPRIEPDSYREAACKVLFSWVSVQASSHGHDWLSHWPLADWTSSLSAFSPPRGWGLGVKSSHPTLTTCLDSWQPVSTLGLGPKVSLPSQHPLHLYGSEAFLGITDEDQISLRNKFWSSE